MEPEFFAESPGIGSEFSSDAGGLFCNDKSGFFTVSARLGGGLVSGRRFVPLI